MLPGVGLPPCLPHLLGRLAAKEREFLPTRSGIESVEVKLGKRVVKDVIGGDLLEVEVDFEAESLAWPDNE
jgi:hypothetical protein